MRRATERVPDWLLGGHVRRRVLEALDEQGWTAIELAEHINAAEPTVFEVFRAMKPLGVSNRSAQGARTDSATMASAVRCERESSRQAV